MSKRWFIVLAFIGGSLGVACGSASPASTPTPTAIPSSPTPVPSPTPDPLDVEVQETLSAILDVNLAVGFLDLWSILPTDGSGDILLTTCEDVPWPYGFEGFQLESIWPKAYKELNDKVSSFCIVAIERMGTSTDPATSEAALALLYDRDVRPLSDAVEGDETFDIEAAIRDRLRIREGTR